MGKLVKLGLVLGGIAVIVVIVLVVVVVSNLDKIVKHVVETVGTETLDTRVALDSASISLKSATGELEGLKIENPPGFDSREAFELGRIEIDIDTSSIGGDEIVLREIVVDQAHLTYEQQGDANNLDALLANLDSAPEEATAEDEEVLLVIETFRLVGAEITLIHDRLDKPLELQLPDVVLNDIGRVGSGETASSAAKQILGPVLTQTLNAAKERAREELEQLVKDEIDERKQEAVESLKEGLLGDR